MKISIINSNIDYFFIDPVLFLLFRYKLWLEYYILSLLSQYRSLSIYDKYDFSCSAITSNCTKRCELRSLTFCIHSLSVPNKMCAYYLQNGFRVLHFFSVVYTALWPTCGYTHTHTVVAKPNPATKAAAAASYPDVTLAAFLRCLKTLLRQRRDNVAGSGRGCGTCIRRHFTSFIIHHHKKKAIWPFLAGTRRFLVPLVCIKRGLLNFARF